MAGAQKGAGLVSEMVECVQLVESSSAFISSSGQWCARNGEGLPSLVENLMSASLIKCHVNHPIKT